MSPNPIDDQNICPFDATYGYGLDDLLDITPPEAPKGFAKFWQDRFDAAVQVHPRPELKHTGGAYAGFEVYDLWFTSTDEFRIAGWVLVPKRGIISQGIIIGHGYSGRQQPDYHLKFPNTVLMFPCFRGLGKSATTSIGQDPNQHVLHDIDSPERYILGGCVEDLWLAVSALLKLFPAVKGRVGYMGLSFGGGIGALASPWDNRINRLHLNLPSFGHNPIRSKLETFGSASAVQQFIAGGGQIDETLAFYDAAISASYGKQPLHLAAAKFDPYVAPPGQFAIYNAWKGSKSLFVAEAGHFDYPEQAAEEERLLEELNGFFSL